MDQQTGEETTDDGMPLKQECNVIDARELVGTFASMLNALISFEPMAICIQRSVWDLHIRRPRAADAALRLSAESVST